MWAMWRIYSRTAGTHVGEGSVERTLTCDRYSRVDVEALHYESKAHWLPVPNCGSSNTSVREPHIDGHVYLVQG